MLVSYFRDNRLKYATRNRYYNITLTPFKQETLRSVVLGDGATTKIKTSVDNICDYVMLDDTRWFVVDYVYLNGKQISMSLQRDVIGELGIDNCFGNIERGYTDSVLRNRKELSVNEILKNRIRLIPDTNTYGNYTVNTHDNEAWGILYLTKPSSTASDEVKVRVPLFAPELSDFSYVSNGTTEQVSAKSLSNIVFYVAFSEENARYKIIIDFIFNNSNGRYSYNVSAYREHTNIENINVYISVKKLFSYNYKYLAIEIGKLVANNVINISTEDSYVLPKPPEFTYDYLKYDNTNIEHGGNIYNYTITDSYENITGQSGKFEKFYDCYINPALSTSSIKYLNIFGEEDIAYINYKMFILEDYSSLVSMLQVFLKVYNTRILTKEEAGEFSITITKNFIDEPYDILVFPLYDVKISTGSTTYDINKSTAFRIFNNVIESMSGDNPYIVDAQIYPYCPFLSSVATVFNNYPFFSIYSTTYNHLCSVNLLPNIDIKKEYIERTYSIVSTDKTSKFNFDYYDYMTEINDLHNDGKNYAIMEILVKTSLKPFAIISAAIIQASPYSLMGIRYASDLRGCSPSSNGFECSLASNAFETYKRQNSNYQELFTLDKEELAKQHKVEKINEITSSVTNIVTGATMGAIAGASIFDGGFLGDLVGSKSAGASVGAGIATALIGGAQLTQGIVNENLRKYERGLQQQRFDLTIGTVKNIPNTVSRISSFNEIILKDFWYVIEVYECSDYEKLIVDNFIDKYGYGIGVYDFFENYFRQGWFLRGVLITSEYQINLHNIAQNELNGGVYIYEQI